MAIEQMECNKKGSLSRLDQIHQVSWSHFCLK